MWPSIICPPMSIFPKGLFPALFLLCHLEHGYQVPTRAGGILICQDLVTPYNPGPTHLISGKPWKPTIPIGKTYNTNLEFRVFRDSFLELARGIVQSWSNRNLLETTSRQTHLLTIMTFLLKFYRPPWGFFWSLIFINDLNMKCIYI